MKVFFIAGTDTGVGKTIVSCAMASAFRLQGYRVGVMKPVACGGWEDSQVLRRASQSKQALADITPIYFKNPYSPKIAGRLEKKRASISKIAGAFKKLQKKHDVMIVEGCGGLLVPITDDFFVIDLIRLIKAEVILVSRSGLGAINHALLSLEALRSRKIEPLGVIFNRLQGGPMSIPEKTNPAVVAKFGRTKSLGMFPYMKSGCATDCGGKAFLKHIDLGKILC